MEAEPSGLPQDLVEETEALVAEFKVQEGVELALKQEVEFLYVRTYVCIRRYMHVVYMCKIIMIVHVHTRMYSLYMHVEVRGMSVLDLRMYMVMCVYTLYVC